MTTVSDDEVPLIQRQKTEASSSTTQQQDTLVKRSRESPLQSANGAVKTEIDDDDDAPLIARTATAPGTAPNKATAPKKRSISKTTKANESDDDDVPLSKLKKVSATKAVPVKPAAPAKGKASTAKSSTTKSSTAKTSTAKSSVSQAPANGGVKKKASKVKEEKPAASEDDDMAEEGEEESRWWENPDKQDGVIKWRTLEHNGVIFPPPYQPLPKHVKMLYNGIPVDIDPQAEEVASFFGTMLNSTHNVENPTFQRNFFADFTEIIKKTGGAKDANGNNVNITEFAKCDFSRIYEHYEADRAAKKALPAAEKKRLKAERDEIEAPYMWCLWDGRKQKVGNYKVEPPSLFRGRGEHPKTGHVKKRVMPEQITINIGKEAKVPPPPPGHRWKEVKHDQEGTWLAMWQENINGNYKYVMLAATSDVKGQSDYKKFEKARELKHHIERIRKDYRKGLKSEYMVERQRATAVYLIDQFALRAGNEKGEDEADTAGCCSLKYEHVELKPPNKVIFDFLGKDSIRFHEEFDCDPQVFKNLKLFKKAPKKEGDEVFDRLTTSALNKHLSNYMPGLTAKVFRTYNASHTMAQELKQMKAVGTVAEKVKAYNDANRRVAILCNHKRTVGATHSEQMEKLGDKIKAMRYQKWRLKQQILALDPKQKRAKGAEWFAIDSDIDNEWIAAHHAFLVEEQKSKITKKFERDNEKLLAEEQPTMKPEELTERLKAVAELDQKLKNERKTGKVEVESKSATVDKLEKAIEKIDARVENSAVQAADKESNKEVALGTSKINYIDPRLTVVFSKKFDVPLEKFFSKMLREKFEWAAKSVEADWEF